MPGTTERYGKGWRYRAQIGVDPGTGRRRWVTKGGFTSEREARKALNRVLVDAEAGLVATRSSARLGTYLLEWLDRFEVDLKPTTAAGYRRAVKKLDAQLGYVRLQELTPVMIEGTYFSMVKEGLAPKSIRNTHAVLRRAMGNAAVERAKRSVCRRHPKDLPALVGTRFTGGDDGL